MVLAAPPLARSIDPVVVEVSRGTRLFRVHGAGIPADRFNPGRGGPARFSPLRLPDGMPIPTLYAATTVAGALSESVFHDMPYRGRGKRILVSRLNGLALSMLEVSEPIHLALLAGLGLRRLEVRRRDLIESGVSAYAMTAAWAFVIHQCPMAPAGLLWTSRQDDIASALVLFGDRLAPGAVATVSGPAALDGGPGLALVDDAASLAAITVIR